MMSARCTLLLATSLVSAWSAEPPQEFARYLEYTRTAMLIPLNPDLTHPLEVLREHEALEGWDLQVFSPNTFQWMEGAKAWCELTAGRKDGWLALDARGQVVAKGVAVPKAEALVASLQQAGLRQPVEQLRAFLASHPDHQEARATYLNLLHVRLVRRTVRQLKLAGRRPAMEDSPQMTASEWTGAAVWKPESAVKLSDQQDAAIWGPYARELDAFLTDPSWLAHPITLGEYPAEAHSPLMIAALRRNLPKVEEALQAWPEHHGLWEMWVRFRTVLADQPPAAFLASLSLVPRPGAREFFPPAIALGLVVEEARRTRQWQVARGLLWPRFLTECGLDIPDAPVHKEAEIQRMRANDAAETWKHLVAPLLEALVACGEENRALQVAQRMRQDPHLVNAQGRLQSLARQLKRPDLASAWIH